MIVWQTDSLDIDVVPVMYVDEETEYWGLDRPITIKQWHTQRIDMRSFLFSATELAEEIISRIETDEAEIITAPNLTRAIFDIEEESLPKLVRLEEFDRVCSAVDLLIDEGRVNFNAESGAITLTD